MESLEKFILSQIALGNDKAFEQLFFQYQPKIVAFLTGLTHDSELSRDMAQELFLSIWKDREKLAKVESISSYLYQMAKYKVFDYFDHQVVTEKYISEYLKQASEAQTGEEEILFARELQQIIDEAVNQMSPQRQKVYRLSRESGLYNEEIANQLDISKRTVENHITAALAILRKVVLLWFLFTRL